MNTKERRNELSGLLKNKEYRDAFVEASLNIGVPSQIRILRKQRGWTQKKLADEATMLQESISRIEDPTRGSVNLKTLLKLASAYDVGLVIKFVPFAEMVDWKLKLSLESLEVESFENDQYFKTSSNHLRGADITQYPSETPAAKSAQLFTIEYLRTLQSAHLPRTGGASNIAVTI